MKTSLNPITYIQTWRRVAITTGSALAMACATTEFAAQPSPTPPTAIATSSPSAVWESDTVTLDAGQSHTNPSGGALEYNWQQQAPGSPNLTLSPNNKSVTVTYIAPAVPLPSLTLGMTFRVKVNPAGDNNNSSFSAPVTTTVYASPGANAGPDMHVNEGTSVTLSGSATRQQSGATFTYTWTAPAGTTFLDTGTSTSHMQNPQFTAPFVGLAGQTLTFTLVVTEHLAGLAHNQDSAPDLVTINVDNVNQPPTAFASADPDTIVHLAEVDENTSVTLYGSGSDPDGDALTYSWTQVQGPTVDLTGDDPATPTFTAPNLTTEDHVDLVFRLVVNDGLLNSGFDEVTIRVVNTNDPPVAVAMATPASAFEGDTVTLNGSGSSDPNDDSLTFTWEQTNGTPVTLTPDLIDPIRNVTFTAPPVGAEQGSITLDFQLTVFDGQLSNTKPISVTVSHVDQAPVADAGDDQLGVPELSNTCLDGSGGFDPDGDNDSLTYSWTQLDGPSVILDNPTSIKPCFDTPDVDPGGANLLFQLVVTNHALSNSDTVLVHVNYENHPPTARGGSDQGVNEGDSVHLDGSGSSDPDGNPLIFSWSQVSGPTVTVIRDPADPSKATFVAPQVPCAGAAVVMRLTVDDTYQDGIATDDVEINVANVNHDPTANAGANQQVQEGDFVSLHGTGDDADDEEKSSLAFQWNQTSGPAVMPSPSSGKDVSFTAPNIGGGDPSAFVELEFTLTVSDTCQGSTTTMPITIHVANFPHTPTAVVTANPTTPNEGDNTVQLDGSMSSDPDMDMLTYTWQQTDGPPVTLLYSPGDTMHIMPSFVTPWVSADTALTFKLTVSDWPGSSSSAYVTVTVKNSHIPPDASHAHADVNVLWPPDHKMALVHIVGLVNPNTDPVTIDSVRQDEPTNGLGDGDTPIDAIISGDTVQLRAERSGNGNGRVYHICFTVHDPEQDATGCVTVSVPKSKKTDVAGDGGSLYDSTH